MSDFLCFIYFSIAFLQLLNVLLDLKCMVCHIQHILKKRVNLLINAITDFSSGCASSGTHHTCSEQVLDAGLFTLASHATSVLW